MKYDDASWHYTGDFPAELPHSAGATHTGMFLAWALITGLGGEAFTVEQPDVVEELRGRTTTPGAFFLKYCDGKFTDEDLNDRGNGFASTYFNLAQSQYLSDYEELLAAGEATLYHVPDSWKSFDILVPRLDERFDHWARLSERS